MLLRLKTFFWTPGLVLFVDIDNIAVHTRVQLYAISCIIMQSPEAH